MQDRSLSGGSDCFRYAIQFSEHGPELDHSKRPRAWKHDDPETFGTGSSERDENRGASQGGRLTRRSVQYREWQPGRSEEHTSELQSQSNLLFPLLLFF